MTKVARILAGRILVQRDQGDNTTEGGVLIPETAVEKKKSGIVILVGDNTASTEIEIKVGDNVLFREDTGQEINLNKPFGDLPAGEYLMIPQGDVLLYERDEDERKPPSFA